MKHLILYTILLFSLISLTTCCKKDYSLISKIQKSAIDEIDLFLIPEKYNVLESGWLSTKTKSSFRKSDLIRYLADHGRYITDLQANRENEYAENNGIVTMKVGKTSHSTDYLYDKNIPIIFHGKWFKSGQYSQKIPQQTIVPTLAKIIGTKTPNGVVESAQNNILTDQNEIPEIIVTVVIDQGGQQLYKAHPDSSIHINVLKAKSAYFPNAEVSHLDAHTAVGHAAIGTGAYPKENGVIGNTFFYLENGVFQKSEIYSFDDRSVNPAELKSETLADIADIHYKNKLEVISQAYALRASIGMGGHGAFPFGNLVAPDKDFVYWLDSKDCKWMTDSKYYSIPDFTREYSPCEAFIKNYPNGWKEIQNFQKEDSKKYWSYLMATPKEAELEVELFRRTISEKIILQGKANDGLPDLAYLTIKATDAAGHYFGWESIEAEETFKEADRQVGILYDFLKNHFGDKFILIITADHGCAPLPELSGGNRFLVEDFFKEINSKLLKNGEAGESLIKKMTVGQISLDHEVMKKYNISENQIIDAIQNITVNEKKFFKKVIKKSEISKT